MLLTHTAGFSYSWYNADLYQWVQSQNFNYSDKIHLFPLVNEPGTKWEYGMSMDWAGAVLEAASGKSLGDWSKGRFAIIGHSEADKKKTSSIHWA